MSEPVLPRMNPCPFCGGVDLSVEPDMDEEEGSRCFAYHVFCHDCHSQGGNSYPICWCETPEMAIERWNDRDNGGDTGKSLPMLQELASKISSNASTIKKVADYIGMLPMGTKTLLPQGNPSSEDAIVSILYANQDSISDGFDYYEGEAAVREIARHIVTVISDIEKAQKKERAGGAAMTRIRDKDDVQSCNCEDVRDTMTQPAQPDEYEELVCKKPRKDCCIYREFHTRSRPAPADTCKLIEEIIEKFHELEDDMVFEEYLKELRQQQGGDSR